MDPNCGREQACPYEVAAPGLATSVKSCDNAEGTVDPRQEFGDGHADSGRISALCPGERHEAGLSLGDLVVASTPALRTVVPESGDRQNDQLQIELHQSLLVKT